MGELPSGPPPTGRIVVLVAVRLFSGTGGYNRRPMLKSAYTQTGDEMGIELSLMTLRRYAICWICSRLGWFESPITETISLLKRSRTGG
jgi:hypothetical protein